MGRLWMMNEQRENSNTRPSNKIKLINKQADKPKILKENITT